MAPPLLSGNLHQDYGLEGVCKAIVVGSCTLQVLSNRVGEYIPMQLISSNSGWHNGWFYLWNDDSHLPCLTNNIHKVCMENWMHDVDRGAQPQLRALLDVL